MLIVAMLISAIIAIALASYLQLTRSGLTISNRALYNNAAMNLAENGLEEAMYSINKKVADDTYDWNVKWTTDGSTSSSSAWRTLPVTQFDQNATGFVRVYVFNYVGVVAPRVVARSTITLGGAASRPIEKWVEIILTKASKFANGLVAKETITFNGNNATVDSWNSDPDNNPATAAIDYDATTKRDNGTVGSISVAVGAIGVNNADIFGYAATGGAAVTVGSQGKVGPFNTPNGTIADGHTSTDFSASFDPVTAPPASYTNINIPNNADYVLPDDTGASAAADGTYYLSAINCDIKQVLKVAAGKKVVLRLTTGAQAIKLTGGSAAINLETGAKLEIYTEGDIDIAGQGVMNGGTTDATCGQPINFQIWGTAVAPDTQNIAVSGNGVYSGIIYAPQGHVTMNGGGNSGNVSGSIVANDITLNGSVKFHYDESLGNMGTGNPYRVQQWVELTTAAQRAAYSSVLDF
jgi:hypothetical protein